MDLDYIMERIVNSIPYPVVFVDCDHIIRYLNAAAQHYYYTERGYDDLIGTNLLLCHNEKSRGKIVAAVEKLKHHGNEVYLGVNVKNQRLYISPVRDEHGKLIGYYERFELNLQK